MTAASPTPFAGGASFGYVRPSTVTGARRQAAPRPTISRSLSQRHSPLSSLNNGHGFSADAPALQSFSIGDSSDDEMPQPPIAFSALTKAILEDKAPNRAPTPPVRKVDRRYHEEVQEAVEEARSRGSTPSSRRALRITRRSSPAQDEVMNGSPYRAQQASSNAGSHSLRRAASTTERRHRPSLSPERESPALITPAPRPRAKSNLASGHGSTSPESAGVQSGYARSNYHSSSSAATSANRSFGAAYAQEQEQEDIAAHGSQDEQNNDRNKSTGDAVPGSIRLKRVPIGSGTFLRGAPMRRAVRRRPSEDQPSAAEEEAGVDHVESDIQHHSTTPAPVDEYKGSAYTSSSHRKSRSTQSRNNVADVDDRAAEEPVKDIEQLEDLQLKYESHARQHSRKQSESRIEHQPPVFKVPPPNISTSAAFDQENDPPPTFKRNKSQAGMSLSTTLEKAKLEVRAAKPSPRKALANMNSNAPARPAPPPPKMSMLETATAAGGASTVKAKKKRSHVIINGKMFTIRGRLGRGGSSEVYKVMAENDKMFALKRVNLEDCNEETVRGFKGEIDLLKKLENVDRVVRLIDWEVNSQKQTLNVLMEQGETDFNHILGHRLHADDAKLDLSFTRHYWREMLECVDAVHAHDIVHSDLKPANFLLVQGRLKLIDFGIANAIDIENTVNVHRETNVGTPNYMSPESLQDTNGGERAPGSAKLMKLGKPSDVWSLGCILYQMVYGKPPFAHIANQWNRIMAIINPTVNISYPTTGVGDVYVPSTLRRLLSRCLNRDATQRPSIAQMLSDKDNFLNPDAERDGAVPMTEELLGQILQRVVDRCRDSSRGIPSNEALRTYPKGFLDNIRASLER